jgi:signal transduction histidine kinase
MIPSLLRRAALRFRRSWRQPGAAARDKYAVLFAASPAAMALVDASGDLLEVNASWERLTGRRAAEVLGRSASQFGLTMDGRRLELVVSAEPVSFGGERLHICTWTDVSERCRIERELQELQALNRELESYNYSLSHDLRQPLAAIAGFVDLLLEQEDALDRLAQTCAREIEANAARMNEIIDSLRRLADSGRGALRLAEVDVGGQVADVLHELSLDVPPGGKVKVGSLPSAKADPALLRQVWTNLIDNALKYSRHSPAPLVEISGERRPDGVEYTVRDNGVGFDMRDAARLFSAFQRLASAAEFEGHGIGLAIVQRIVRRHGGRIVAESQPGKGASFRLTLPA